MLAGVGAGGGGGDDEAEMLEWEIDNDRFSFEDSDRFEEDSLCSWSSEPESVCNNWRGWKKPVNGGSYSFGANKKQAEDKGSNVTSLTELSAKCVASHIPFELVEHVFPPVPEQLQLRIAFWSFPDNEEDIRLYSCLANGSADEFSKGETHHKNNCVKDPLQIGFHLSATVHSPRMVPNNVAVTFDRRRISSCNCTCNSSAYWCSHVVAVCLTRIHWPHLVTLRAPVSESLSRLHRDQLQKFAQYLISELPQQILPTAQRLLDELLGSQPSVINSVCGAPDPTAGASAADQTSWYLDNKALHGNIKKILIKFCVPAPIVFSDVNYLSTTAPPAAAEWTSLLRPLRGREPEGMWNLLSIVREMFKRNDRNAIPLLEIITDECMACEQILVWWFNTKVALLNGSSGYGGGGGGGGGKHNNVNSNTHASQHACSSLCDEVVILWRLAALNPGLAPQERDMLHHQFNTWHLKVMEKVSKCRSGNNNNSNKNGGLKMDLEVFTGFKPAIEACYMDWEDYPMPGITYTQDTNPMYHCPFTCFRHSADSKTGDNKVPQVNSSKAVLNCEHHLHHRHSHHAGLRSRYDFIDIFEPVDYTNHAQMARDGNRSSVSSEGFCENDDDLNIIRDAARVMLLRTMEFDSQEGGSESSSSSGSSNRETSAQQSSSDSTEGKKPVPSTSKDEERRPSKDESSLSDSSPQSQSGDEYNVYFYNPKELAIGERLKIKTTATTSTAEDSDKNSVFSNLKRSEDPWDVLFARAEGLHAHGHNKEASMLAVKLAEELLANPPDLMIDIPPIPKRKGKKQHLNPATHQLSCLASATLAKCAFLCSVLAENSEHSHLSFRVGMFGLEMARPPASTKPLEVKLANQESDLVSLLKKIPLGHRELQILRERAEQLKDGTLKSRGEAMLPLMLSSFIFEALVMPSIVGRERSRVLNLRLPTDEPLGFEAAVAAMGLKANVSEADHPLLCEGTRRQKSDLAITLLVFYKDDCWKVARIMDRLLDKDIHQLLKGPILNSYYSSNPPIKSQYSNLKREEHDKVLSPLNSFLPPNDILSGDMNSRPQSSTSAEIEQGLANITLGPSTSSAVPTQSTMSATGVTATTITTTSSMRTKEGRYKGKRAYPSIPNQPSEAGAHFMFELAKTVLIKAGGTSSTSLFTQPSTSQNHHGPHRALHMCAFQLGLYALGLHNCVSPNWLSRTYSSHVSWITGQAMEIGAAAIAFLIETWENHLTPPEVANIADRASRGCDVNMVRAAAELALSCLPHAHALNPNEISRAILQCKEQSDLMLEHACLTVENAAKGGGVYPEVLFQVAKYWYELYLRHTPGGEQLMENDLPHDPILDGHGALVALIETPEISQPPPVVVTTASPQYVPYAYSFTVHPHVSYGGPIHPHATVSLQPPPHMQMYLPAPQFPYPPHSNAGPPNAGPPAQYQLPPPQAQAPQPSYQPPPTYVASQNGPYTQGPSPYAPLTPPYLPPPQNNAYPPQPSTYNGPTTAQMQYYGAAVTIAQPPRPGHMYPVALAQTAGMPVATRPHRQQLNQIQLRYLLAAYRVGMLAMETLARRVHDDRPQAKYARNPPYGEDVKWLLRISKHLEMHLGTQYLHQFCVSAVNSIVSPFVLHDVAMEAAQYLGRSNPGLMMRTALTPLIQKCQQMYIQCMHQKLYHLTVGDYEDFVNIVLAARAAFQITPDGSAQFKEWLQSIKRSKSCKKDLWGQINTALQSNAK
ncbi:PREDICTED: zinc finger SWIM domain-containing protein 8 [Nicrophorus vespilloides]|uniref:Zinc finger SWIM domain-containing protein 8 n=1 Tax=Nicrophorus vespilloides TaxID=110193 RepID=A0ABM1MQZ7_NICVS|nr:PREDICTED: zinc finger SWIM domain-containing protein 8 [Nicrophorus vespilloides]